MTEIDIDALEKLAEATTMPTKLVAFGTWLCAEVTECTCAGFEPYGHEPKCGLEPLFDVGDERLAAFIAACDPETIKVLCRRTKDAEAMQEELKNFRTDYVRELRARADAAEADRDRLTAMLYGLGFCAKCGESMPCMTCGAGL